MSVNILEKYAAIIPMLLENASSKLSLGFMLLHFI